MPRITNLAELNQPFKAGRAWLQSTGSLMLHPDDLARAGINDRAAVLIDVQAKSVSLRRPHDREAGQPIEKDNLAGQMVMMIPLWRCVSGTNIDLDAAAGLYRISWQGDVPSIVLDGTERPTDARYRGWHSKPW